MIVEYAFAFTLACLGVAAVIWALRWVPQRNYYGTR